MRISSPSLYVLEEVRRSQEGALWHSPVIHELKLTRGSPARGIIVETGREVGRTAVGSPFSGIAGAVAVEKMEASNTAGVRSLRTRVDTERTALDTEPGREVAPVFEDVERGFRVLLGGVLLKSQWREKVRCTGVERV